MIFLALILIVIAAVAKAIMDTLQFHFAVSRFVNLNPQFWDPSVSWKNKYSNVSTLTSKKLFWIIPYPVFLTDAWHLFQFIFLNTLFVGVILAVPIDCPTLTLEKLVTLFILLRVLFGVVFTVWYNSLSNR